MTEGTVRETPGGLGDARGFRPAGGERAEPMGGFVPGQVAPFVTGRSGVARRAGRGMREYLGALTTLLILVVILGSTEPGFFAVGNVQNVLETNAPLFLVSIGILFTLISAGFDLSVGSMMAVSGWMLVIFINDMHLSPLLAIVLAVLCCGAIGGVLNGISIGVLKLNFFVTTLGALILLQGIIEVASGGVTTPISSSFLSTLGNGTVGTVPISFLICVGALIVGWFVLRKTTFGRAVYSVGGNPEAARLSGVSVSWTLVGVYAFSGLCSGLAGVVAAGRLSAATPTAGGAIELTSAAAVLLGGASLAGGVGKLAGMTCGVLVLAVLANGINLLGLSAYWQDVVTGAVLLIAIVLDRAHKSGSLKLRGALPWRRSS
ncbi:MAG: ABC transporter permease [Actinomycetota bacterium]|nr:ABC transporter permease [Actinomycetota bacterium]MDA8185580.1 ABC transporter permease [Actinomycetota bacterium]